MIVSDENRYVFVEVPHTGSHSISEQLVKHYGGKPILRKHANVTQYLKWASPDQRSYFKFATVRNPLDTAVTDYEKLKNNHKGQFTDPEKRFENGGHVTKDHRREFEFVNSDGVTFADFYATFRAKLYNNWFLVGDQHFDYVIQFEALQIGFSKVLQSIGVPEVEPIPHVNRTAGKKLQFDHYYGPEIRGLAAACYGPFMQKWGYGFPKCWGDVSVPLRSRLQFGAVDAAARTLSQAFPLDPDARHVRRAKKLLDYLTRK